MFSQFGWLGTCCDSAAALTSCPHRAIRPRKAAADVRGGHSSCAGLTNTALQGHVCLQRRLASEFNEVDQANRVASRITAAGQAWPGARSPAAISCASVAGKSELLPVPTMTCCADIFTAAVIDGLNPTATGNGRLLPVTTWPLHGDTFSQAGAGSYPAAATGNYRTRSLPVHTGPEVGAGNGRPLPVTTRPLHVDTFSQAGAGSYLAAATGRHFFRMVATGNYRSIIPVRRFKMSGSISKAVDGFNARKSGDEQDL